MDLAAVFMDRLKASHRRNRYLEGFPLARHDFRDIWQWPFQSTFFKHGFELEHVFEVYVLITLVK